MCGNSLRHKEFPLIELPRIVANLRRSCSQKVMFFSQRECPPSIHACIGTTFKNQMFYICRIFKLLLNFQFKDLLRIYDFSELKKKGLDLPAWGCSRTQVDHWSGNLENAQSQASSVDRKGKRTQTLHTIDFQPCQTKNPTCRFWYNITNSTVSAT